MNEENNKNIIQTRLKNKSFKINARFIDQSGRFNKHAQLGLVRVIGNSSSK